MQIQELFEKSTEPDLTKIANCVDWLNTYIASSMVMSDKFLKTGFVVDLLKPLINAVPYTPVRKELYHLFDANNKDSWTMDPGRVTSLTYESKKSGWRNIADAIGLYGKIGICEVKEVYQLTNSDWLSDKVLPFLKNKSPDMRFLDDLDLHVKGYKWQKEVIVFSNHHVEYQAVDFIEN